MRLHIWNVATTRLSLGTYATHAQEYWTSRGQTYADEEAWLRGPGSLTDRQGAALAGLLTGAQTVLEVGCGYGRLLRELHTRRPDLALTGIDFSPSQLARARSYCGQDSGIVLRDAAGDALPFADGTFDVAYTQGCLMHVPPALVEGVRVEMRRVAGTVVHIEETVSSDDGTVFAHDNAASYTRAGWWCHPPVDYPWLVPGQHPMRVETFTR